MNRKVSLLVAAALLTAFGARAQSTGTIEGKIIDETQSPLPGVMIVASSPALMDAKVAVTDPGGHFRFALLRAGEYKLVFTMSGFTNQEKGNVSLSSGRTVSLGIVMKAATDNAVQITSGAPILDSRTAEISHNISAKQFRALPLQRDYTSIVLTTPGTVDTPDGAALYGSKPTENAYSIDGVNTTGLAKGGLGKALIPEFVEEINVKSDGYAARYGRATGGLVNVITKSGGNQFHGDFFGFLDRYNWQAPRSKAQNNLASDRSHPTRESSFTNLDYGLGYGGFFVRDRLWFFLGGDRADNKSKLTVKTKELTQYGGPAEWTKLDQSDTRTIWITKLTGRLADNHSLILSVFADPSKRTGPSGDLSGPALSYTQDIFQGGADGLLRWEGVFGQSLVASVQWSKHAERNLIDGPGAATPLVFDNSTALYNSSGITLRTGGLGTFSRERFVRNGYRADFSYFLGDFAGDHDLSFGIDYEKVAAQGHNYYSGGHLVRKLCAAGKMPRHNPGEEWRPCPPEWVYYQHETYIRSSPLGGNLTGDLSYYLQNPYTVNSRSTAQTYYVQDNWRPIDTLTIDAGLRFDEQRLFDTHGSVSVKLKKQLSPRLGVVWDFKGDGTTKLFGSYGIFHETLPLELALNSFGGEIIALVNNGNAKTISCDPRYNGGTSGFSTCSLKLTDATHVAANVKGQRTQEYVLGGEMEMSRNLTLSGRYIHRRLSQILTGGLDNNQAYTIGNPGYPGMKLAYDESRNHSFPAVKPYRLFRGIELVANKRFANNWQLFASYLYSRLEGNYESAYPPSVADGAEVPAFDYAELQVNGEGYLSQDRRHQLHVFGSYQFKSGINVGFHTYYRTGIPVTAYGYDTTYHGWVLLLSKRGDWDRTKPENRTDFNLTLPIKFKGGAVNVLFDFFNLFNQQTETGRDQRYTLTTQAFSTIDSQGHIQPAISPSTPCSSLTASANCNPNFNTTNSWQSPRLFRLGIRITF